MQSTFNEKLIAYLALLSGLSISAMAVYYSVVGLTAIFAAAAIPIIVMGTTLEVGKLVATVWLKQYWAVAPKLIRLYLFIAIAVLMLITSMGIFGFLSKAHLDQSVPSGEVADKLAVIDEKIKTQKENIESARKALQQMNEAVDQTMSRTTDDAGANRAANLRRAQQRERQQLQSDIATAQKQISQLNEERAPIAKEQRQVEAEVGPIKYIAAFFYESTEKDILEKAVTWVIIILIVVFDPLAVILLLASQYSFQKLRDDRTEKSAPVEEKITLAEVAPDQVPADQYAYLKKPWTYIAGLKPVVADVAKPEILEEPQEQQIKQETIPLKTYDWTQVPPEQEYIVINGEHLNVKAAKVLYPQTPKPVMESYVQNEEQGESGLWKELTTSSNQISQQDYFHKAEENAQKNNTNNAA